MSRIDEFVKMDKDKDSVLKFLDSYKDDPRLFFDIDSLSEYAELCIAFDDVLLVEQTNKTNEYEEIDEYWAEHPTYKQMEASKNFLGICASIHSWTDIVSDMIRGYDEQNIYGIWKYIEKLVQKELKKGIYLDCKVSDPRVYYELYEDPNLFPAIMEDVTIPSDAKNIEPYLLCLRDNLLSLSKGKGAMTLCFRHKKTDEVDRQLVMAGDGENLYVYDGNDGQKSGNLIVPSIEGLQQSSGNDIVFILCD